jgi:hypothetical protein
MPPSKKPAIIELEPTEWTADIPNKREPFFVPGLPFLIAQLIGFALMVADCVETGRSR